MIIEVCDDLIRLSGSLRSNQWPCVKATLRMLLRHSQQGIVIDCAGLDTISEEGAATFVQALGFISRAETPVTLTTLPPHVVTLLEASQERSVPLPLAQSVRAARIAHTVSSVDWWSSVWDLPHLSLPEGPG